MCLKVTLQTCGPENFRSCRWGGRVNGQPCADGERGPPSARVEICSYFLYLFDLKDVKDYPASKNIK
jgi:hypothetical protein